MGTHRVTIELADDSYALLRSAVESGEYASGSEAVEVALLDFEAPSESIPPANGRDYEEWLHSEAIAAYDAHHADPHAVFTSEQVLLWLEEQRARDVAA